MRDNDQAQPLPSIFIATEQFQGMIEKYQTEKYPLLRDAQVVKGATRSETKSIWYSKEHIETLLNEISLMNANGLRIYFGAYAEDHPVAPGQQCLLMVPTRATENGTGNQDIVYENEPGFQDRMNATINSRSLELPEEGTPKPFNYGSPCPPIC